MRLPRGAVRAAADAQGVALGEHLARARTARDTHGAVPQLTFLFTDIEGSTKHVTELGTARWEDVYWAVIAVRRRTQIPKSGSVNS